jgi:hypothetical protein
MWFGNKCGLVMNARLPQETKTKHVGRCNKEEYKEKRRKEQTIRKTNKKEWINVELENMELLRIQHE